MQISRAIDNAAARLGHHSIKQEQRAAIQAFVAGEDVSAYRLRGGPMLIDY